MKKLKPRALRRLQLRESTKLERIYLEHCQRFYEKLFCEDNTSSYQRLWNISSVFWELQCDRLNRTLRLVKADPHAFHNEFKPVVNL